MCWIAVIFYGFEIEVGRVVVTLSVASSAWLMGQTVNVIVYVTVDVNILVL